MLCLGELPDPVPGPGEVRVRIHCSGVNPSDAKARAGSRGMPFPLIVPHSDGAGVIDQVGPGVPATRIGERVWVWNAAWNRPMGTAAQFVALPSAQAVRLPDQVGFDVGACLGIPALTALHAMLVAGGVRGKTVLVNGGTGAVGFYAVQFARLLGARQVLATVGSPEKAALCLQAGADDCFQYRSVDVTQAVRERTAGRGVDRVIEVDVAANGALLPSLLRQGGEAVVYGSGAPTFTLPFGPCIARMLSLHFFIVYELDPEQRQAALSLLQAWLHADLLIHRIDRHLALPETALAHELVLSGQAAGKLLVTIE